MHISQMVDLENKENSEELVAAIQKKISGLGREGLLKVADRGVVAKSEEGPAAEPKSEAARRERTRFEMQL